MKCFIQIKKWIRETLLLCRSFQADYQGIVAQQKKDVWGMVHSRECRLLAIRRLLFAPKWCLYYNKTWGWLNHVQKQEYIRSTVRLLTILIIQVWPIQSQTLPKHLLTAHYNKCWFRRGLICYMKQTDTNSPNQTRLTNIWSPSIFSIMLLLSCSLVSDENSHRLSICRISVYRKKGQNIWETTGDFD